MSKMERVMEEVTDVIKAMDAVNVLKAEINNRQVKRQDIWEKIVSLDGEIMGLREALHRVESLPGYNAVLAK